MLMLIFACEIIKVDTCGILNSSLQSSGSIWELIFF
jgi:hypothetical protein